MELHDKILRHDLFLIRVCGSAHSLIDSRMELGKPEVELDRLTGSGGFEEFKGELTLVYCT